MTLFIRAVWGRLVNDLSENRLSAYLGLLVLLFTFLAHLSVYLIFGTMSGSQPLYWIGGVFYFNLCLLIFISQKRKIFAFIAIPFYLTLDVISRLTLSYFWETFPGVHRMFLDWESAALILTARFVLLLFMVPLFLLYSKLNRFVYAFAAIILALISAYITAVHIPCMINEPLYSYEVGTTDAPYLRVNGCSDETTFLLTPLIQNDNVFPSQPRIWKEEGETFIFNGWDRTEEILGTRCCCENNESSFVLRTSNDTDDTACLRFMRFSGEDISHDLFYECPKPLVPDPWSNCLSADGTLVALNNGKFISFEAGVKYNTFIDMDDAKLFRFVEWTTTNKDQALYYDYKESTAFAIDPDTNELAFTHTLKIGGPDVLTLTLSPNGQKLLYTRRFSNYFFCDDIRTDDMDRINFNYANADSQYSPPCWVDDKRFIYVSRSLILRVVDMEERYYRTLSQWHDTVLWAAYEPSTRRLLWTTIGDNNTRIHAKILE